MAKQQKLIEWTIWLKYDNVVVAADTFSAPSALICSHADRWPYINAAIIQYGKDAYYKTQPTNMGKPL